MPDMGSIAAAIGSIKSAGEIAKGMLTVRDAAVMQAKVIELQTEILAAQTSALSANADQFSLLKRVSDLETEIAQLEAWEAEKKRYQLTEFGGGTFAYVLKPEAAGGEPPHRICPNCYGEGHKSILQFGHRNAAGQDLYTCPRCKTQFTFGHRQERDFSRPGRSSWT